MTIFGGLDHFCENDLKTNGIINFWNKIARFSGDFFKSQH
jgi:hypothetical protein